MKAMVFLIGLLVLSGCLEPESPRDSIGVITIDDPVRINQDLNFGVQTSNSRLVQDYDLYYYYDNNNLVLKFYDVNECLEIKDAVGSSMKPFSKDKAKVLVDFCFPRQDLEVGDVIIFYTQDRLTYVYHRIVSIDKEKEIVVTKGDNLEIEDDQIRFNQIVGKVIANFNLFHSEEKKPLEFEIKDTLTIDSIIVFNPSIEFNGEHRFLINNTSGWLVAIDTNSAFSWNSVLWVARKYYDINTMTETKLIFTLKHGEAKQK